MASPLDVSRIRGVCALDDVPIVAYQHESQAGYPTTGSDASHRNSVIADWMSWLAADEVWFNSATHRRQVTATLPGIVRQFNDPVHDGLVETVQSKFRTLPIGLDLDGLLPQSEPASVHLGHGPRPLIVWPHRWEPDKDPAAFDRAVARLKKSELEFGLVLGGTVPNQGPDRRRSFAIRHEANVVACGPLTRDVYRRWLRASDLVVSCANHEFFGVGVAEAVAAGCEPVVPFGLAYQEVLGDQAKGYEPGYFGTALENAVRAWHTGRRPSPTLAAGIQRYAWSEVVARYDAALDELTG